ncbi:hypothetical protein [Sulfurimonas sp. NW9]|uniref:hypothetical protein n=1 Tax=Sulfurimonas sp. NW9 TaxID=2922728 RepID=UPI003DA83CCE
MDGIANVARQQQSQVGSAEIQDDHKISHSRYSRQHRQEQSRLMLLKKHKILQLTIQKIQTPKKMLKIW